MESGELDAERGRLGVNAMAASNGRRHLVLKGAFLQRGEDPVQTFHHQVCGAHELHIQTGIEDV